MSIGSNVLSNKPIFGNVFGGFIPSKGQYFTPQDKDAVIRYLIARGYRPILGGTYKENEDKIARGDFSDFQLGIKEQQGYQLQLSFDWGRMGHGYPTYHGDDRISAKLSKSYKKIASGRLEKEKISKFVSWLDGWEKKYQDSIASEKAVQEHKREKKMSVTDRFSDVIDNPSYQEGYNRHEGRGIKTHVPESFSGDISGHKVKITDLSYYDGSTLEIGSMTDEDIKRLLKLARLTISVKK